VFAQIRENVFENGLIRVVFFRLCEVECFRTVRILLEESKFEPKMRLFPKKCAYSIFLHQKRSFLFLPLNFLTLSYEKKSDAQVGRV
jgi:hypothetical protein